MNKIKKIFQKYNSLSIPAKASIWFVVCSCIQSGIKFISLPIFANIIDVSEYGKVTLYTSWFSIIYIFATLSLGKANGVFYVAMVKHSDDKDRFTTSMEGLNIALCSVTFILLYLSTLIFGDWMSIGINQYPAMCLELIGYGIILIWSLRMRYDCKYKKLLLMTFIYSIGNIIVPIIGVILCPENVSTSAIKNWCGAIFTLLTGLIALVDSLKKSKKIVNFKYWKYATVFNIVLIPHYLSNVILVHSDRIMIAKIINETVAAIYNVAYTLGVAAQVITQALINAINPWMYKKIKDGDEGKIEKVVVPLLLVVAIIILIICLIMPETFKVFFPEAYSSALNVIPPVATGVLFAFIFNLYASVELYFSGNKFVSLASVTGALINIIANFILIPKFGFIIAAYTTLICDIIYAFMHMIFYKILLNRNNYRLNILPTVPIWIIGGLSLVSMAFILMLYPLPVIRYSIILIFIIIAIILRKKILKLLKFKSV